MSDRIGLRAAGLASAALFVAASTAMGAVAEGLFVGTASGFVVAPIGTPVDEITGGQNATQVYTGPASATLPNSSYYPPSGSQTASTTLPGTNRAKSDSRGGPPGSQSTLYYAGSYWGDVITFTGGEGSFGVSLTWGLDGRMNDSGGDYLLSNNGKNPPSIAGARTDEGKTAVRYRPTYGAKGEYNTNLSPTNEGPDFFLKLATQDTGAFDLPVEYTSNATDSVDTFLIRPENPEPGYDPDDLNDPQMQYGALTTDNRGRLRATGVGASFTWEYDVPMAIGMLLETWAIGGAVADFWNTAGLVDITVDAGTVVTSESGTVYPVTYIAIPEPATAALLATGGLLARRRRPR